MFIQRQICTFLRFFPVDLHHVPQLEGQSGHYRILVLFDQLLSLLGLHLHRGPLFDGSEDVCGVGEHEDPLVEGGDVGVGVHPADYVELGVLLEDDGHDLLEVLDVLLVLLGLGVQVPRNEHVAVEEHGAGVLVPVEQVPFLLLQPLQHLAGPELLVEAVPFGEDESVLVRADLDEVLLLELLEVLHQQLIGLLDEDHVSHRLVHALLELLQLFLLVQERLLEIRLVLLQVLLRTAPLCVVQVQNLEDLE